MKKSQRTLETCKSHDRRRLKLVTPVATQDKPIVTIATAVHAILAVGEFKEWANSTLRYSWGVRLFCQKWRENSVEGCVLVFSCLVGCCLIGRRTMTAGAQPRPVPEHTVGTWTIALWARFCFQFPSGNKQLLATF